MIITDKIADLLEYKVLSNEKPKLENEIKKCEKELDDLDVVMNYTKVIANSLDVNQKDLETAIGNYYARIDKLRIEKSLMLTKIEQRLLEFELNPYKE